MSPRKAVDKELSRPRIMEAARALFAEHRYRAVSMRMIATKLGYSHGALYYHFKEKAELFCALVAEDFIRLNELLQEVVAAGAALPGRSLLEKVMLEFIRFGLENKKHYEIMFMIDDPDLRRYAQPEKDRSYLLFAGVVSEQLQRMNGRPADARTVWSLFLSLHGFVSYYVETDQSYDDLRGLAERHAAFLCDGLAAAGPGGNHRVP